jgi:sugar/nucleoside kinase (ribokinase family)
VYGHVSVDQIISVAEFPRPNTSVDAVRKTTNLGGIATNISVMASSLGVPTAICVFVGHDIPENFVTVIKEHGVITDEMVKTDYDTSTAIIINNSSLDQTVCFFQGAQGCASEHGVDLIKNASMSDAVHFSTGDPDYYIRLMGMLSDGMRKIAFDPAQEIRDRWQNGRFLRALELSDILFCNEHESEAVLNYLGIDSLSKVDKELVVCTRGAKGSEAYIDGRLTHIPAIRPKKAVDPTGAGDAYRAGFYAGMYHKYGIEKSLLLASAVSSFAVEGVGALSVIPSWDDVLERADRELTRM